MESNAATSSNPVRLIPGHEEISVAPIEQNDTYTNNCSSLPSFDQHPLPSDPITQEQLDKTMKKKVYPLFSKQITHEEQLVTTQQRMANLEKQVKALSTCWGIWKKAFCCCCPFSNQKDNK